MLYDIRTTPQQLKKLGEWVQVGDGTADVELVADDSMLLAEQGDERMAWDADKDASEGSEEYLSVAPLDPPRRSSLPARLVSMMYPERFPEGHELHDPDHMYWTSGGTGAEGDVFEWSAETIEWVAAELEKHLPDGWKGKS